MNRRWFRNRARFIILFSVGLIASIAFSTEPSKEDKIIIAHRGASAYLPEHTMEAYAFAYAQGADYLEPDLVLTKDGVPIALHDLALSSTTDVARRFPDRARANGQFYAIDFTLAEIKQLKVKERVNHETEEQVYPMRWRNRHEAIHFRVPTLKEVIELVQGLNESTGRDVGIYPEIKSAAWHIAQGYEFERILMDVLEEYGYTLPKHNVIVQSFSPESLIRLRRMGSELTLVQLIRGEGEVYDEMVTVEGLDRILEYANGIGPSVARLFDSDGTPVHNHFLVKEASKRGLIVHPYTMRADDLPGYVASYEELLEKVFFQAGADGVFTDHPDLTVRFLKERAR